MRKPSKALLRRIRVFLEQVHREANTLADEFDPKREGPGEDNTCVLTIVDGLAKKAGYGLHLPSLQLDKKASK